MKLKQLKMLKNCGLNKPKNQHFESSPKPKIDKLIFCFLGCKIDKVSKNI